MNIYRPRAHKHRPILRYHGGKWRLAPWIISYFPPHRIYVEPFGGGGSVLLRKPRSYSEVYNDRWGIVVNVFRILRDPRKASKLRKLLYLTPYAREEFVSTGDIELAKVKDTIERARRTILRSMAGFGSAATNAAHATGFRANANRSGTTPAHDWAHYPDYVPWFVERLRGVLIENRPASKVIDHHDGPETLVYCDPPYPQGTRNVNRGNATYVHDFTDNEHIDLARQLHKLQGSVIVSGYRCELYDKLYKGWKRVQRTGALADGARKRTEVLWISPKAARRK